MAAQILSFFQRPAPLVRDWAPQEIAEFYRVESALVQAGVQLESDRGVSDEGDPWFIFCRADTGDVFIHFARIDGLYVVDGASFEEPARGSEFAALVRALIARYPLAKARQQTNSNVFVHPAALLIALVGAAFFQTSEAKATETHDGQDGKAEPRRHSALLTIAQPSGLPLSSAPGHGEMDARQFSAVVLSAVLILREERIFLVSEAAHFGSLAVDLDWQHVSLGGAMVSVAEPVNPAAAPEVSVSQAAVEAQPVADWRVATRDPQPWLEALRTGNDPDYSPIVGSADARTEIAFVAPSPPAASSLDEGSSKTIFILKPAAAPLSAGEALAIIAASQALAGLLAMTPPQVDKLPESIIALINRGDQVGITNFPIQGSEVRPQLGPTLVQGGQYIDPSAPSPVTSESSIPILPVFAEFDSSIDAAIARFHAQVKNVDIIVQAKQIVLYDRNVLNPFAPDLNFDSVTFRFEDGSTISLVGTASVIDQVHWPV
ncbi:hypothetical protein [Tabrizicola sp.]|uniref:hypothetical protein n=1 Tax=Tabrizicola sp. TaxID=2005166 RepID=UPI0027343AAE|nr:hypothetical protein [Tabrizicola sp.]MDP3196643.1 hypothetical protein [Tabrizicola sp.]